MSLSASARNRLARAALIAVVAACATAWAQAPMPDAPSGWVTDRARLLSLETAARLDARLAAFERASGHQVLVYIDRTTGGVPLEDWTARAFARWRVGRKGIDDGVVLFVFAQDRRVRIEVGYGLEERLPDARAARIVDDVVVPAMRAGRPDEALSAGAEAVLAAVGGGAAAPAPQDFLRDVPGWTLAAGALLVILAMIGFATNPSIAAWLLLFMSRGRWGGGGGPGESGLSRGGFTGGGGRSGGGGASGSW
jgi:uncharacterized protein